MLNSFNKIHTLEIGLTLLVYCLAFWHLTELID